MQDLAKTSSRRSNILLFLRFLHFFLEIYLEYSEYFVSNLFKLSHFVISLDLSGLGVGGVGGGRSEIYRINMQNLAKSSSRRSFFFIFYVFYIFSWTYIWKNLNILSQISSN